MKKIYTKPEIAVVDIKPTQLLNGSGDTQTIPVYTESEEFINDEKNVW